MHNFNLIFKTIKNHCKEIEVPNSRCFQELNEIFASQNTFMSVDYYLSVLHDLELIKYSSETKTIWLTEKGMLIENLFDPN